MRILLVADCPPIGAFCTGFGRVAAHIGMALHNAGHDVTQIAVNWRRQTHDYPWVLIQPKDKDPLGYDKLTEMLKRKPYDAVLGFNDLWVCNRYFSLVYAHNRLQGQSVGFYGYFPVDAFGLPDELVSLLPHWDGVATYTEFGKGVLQDAGYRGPVEVIPHGVDRRPQAQHLRDKLPNGCKDAFIVLRTDINRPRKRYDLAIQAFCEFAAGKPLPPHPAAPVLWLHCAPYGDDIPVREYYEQCLNRTGYTYDQRPLLRSDTNGNWHPWSDDETLARMYATADVYLQTSDAEGWGLCPVEAAQQGALVIAGANSIHPELWDGAAILVQPLGYRAQSMGIYRLGNGGKPEQVRITVQHPIHTAETYAHALDIAWQDRALCQNLRTAAQQRWSNNRYDWGVIESQFVSWIEGG